MTSGQLHVTMPFVTLYPLRHFVESSSKCGRVNCGLLDATREGCVGSWLHAAATSAANTASVRAREGRREQDIANSLLRECYVYRVL
jgi:hypothetical protein